MGTQPDYTKVLHPNVGGFITEDLVRGSLTDPQTLNRYVYCRNNPLKYTDPDGRFINLVAAVIGAAAGAIIGAVAHLSNNPSDFQGAAVSAGMGAVGGLVTGLTMGAVLTVLAPSVTTAAAAGVTKVVLAGAAGKVAGGIVERSLEEVAHSAQTGEPISSDRIFAREAMLADAVGGAIGSLISYGSNSLISGKFNDITRTYIGYSLGAATISKGVARVTSDFVEPYLEPYYTGPSRTGYLDAIPI